MNVANLTENQLDLFYENTLKLCDAVNIVGGSAFTVLLNQSDFIMTLSRNGIGLHTVIHKGIA